MIGGEKDVGGLAGGEQYGVDGKWLDIGRVNLYHGEIVAGDFEEELRVQSCVDYPKEVCFGGRNH